jgi:hypothetical protein
MSDHNNNNHDDDHGHRGHHNHHEHHGRRHHHDDDLPLTFLNSTLDITATDGSGHTLNGGGNSASGWEIQTLGAIQLASDVHYRQGDTVQPDAIDHDGTLIYHIPAGAQVADPAHHVPGANPDRAAANFDYSFDTGVGPGTHQTIQQFLASGGQFLLNIDLDPGTGNNPLQLHAVYDTAHNAGGSHVVWEDSHNHIVIGDDGGNAYVTQNSQNYAFYQSLIDVDPHHHGVQTGPIGPDGQFEIEEQIVAPHHNVIADIHSELIIGSGAPNDDHWGHNKHDDDDNLPPTLLNATLDPTATDGNHHALNGSGIPDAGWETENNGSFQLATNVHYRQGAMAQPTAVNSDGTLFYNMPAGPQVVDNPHGVSTANANRGATSFDFSFDTGVGPGSHQTIQQFLASGGQFLFNIDLDSGAGNDPLQLHAVYDPVHNTGGSHLVWQDNHHNIVIADDGGNQYVTQNSQNLAFYQSLIDVDPHHHGVQTGPISPVGTYDIQEQIVAPHHDVLADIHSVLLLA